MNFDVKQNLRIQYLDRTTFEYTNIQCDSYEISIERGIDVESYVFARPKVGMATVKLMKSNLSDLMTVSGPPYRSNDLFRIQVEYIPGGWLNLFAGVIQNFYISYDAENKNIAITIEANDFMKIGLGTQIGLFIVPSGASRSYINVMNQLETAINTIDSRFSMSRAGTVGSSTFQMPASYEQIGSGELFDQFLDAELGWLWSDRDNEAKYLTRGDVTALQAMSFTATGLLVSNIHSNSVDHVCMNYMDLSYASDEIANQVRVTNPTTGVRTTSTNATSVASFGRQLADFTVDFDPSSGTTYANWASEVASAATPRRLNSVTVPMVTDLGDISEIVTKDIGDTLNVRFRATGFSDLDFISIVTQLNHTITPQHWELNVGLWRGV